MCLWNTLCILSVLDLCFSVLLPRIAASLHAQEYYCELRVRQVTQSVCSQPVNLLWNCIPVLKRGVAISALSVWITVPCGAVPSVGDLFPGPWRFSSQWALCTYTYCCCGTLLRIFSNYTWSRSSHASCCCFIGEKMQSNRGEVQQNGDGGKRLAGIRLWRW